MKTVELLELPTALPGMSSLQFPDTGFHVSCEKAACAIAALLGALSQMMAARAASVDVTYWFTPSTTHSYAGMRDEYVCLARCRKVGKRRCQDPPAG